MSSHNRPSGSLTEYIYSIEGLTCVDSTQIEFKFVTFNLTEFSNKFSFKKVKERLKIGLTELFKFPR